MLPQLPPLDGLPTDVGYREVDLLSGNHGPLVRKPQAAQGTPDFVRGSMASVPFKPGTHPPSVCSIPSPLLMSLPNAAEPPGFATFCHGDGNFPHKTEVYGSKMLFRAVAV